MLIQNKDIIRSIAIANPRIKQIKGSDIKKAPPSINFFLSTCIPDSSTTASGVSSTTSVITSFESVETASAVSVSDDAAAESG